MELVSPKWVWIIDSMYNASAAFPWMEDKYEAIYLSIYLSILPAIEKDVLPTNHRSNLIHEFVCHCDSRYVGRTSQRLQDRIKQHVPKFILNNSTTSKIRSSLSRACKTDDNSSQPCFHESAIGQHLLDNKECASQYSDSKFSILFRGRSKFHLSALEATFIKSLKPNLCKQKEFVYSLKLS